MKFLGTGWRSILRAAVAALTLFSACASAQPLPDPPAKPCQAIEHRQFDFWVGQWDVFGPAGKKVGENKIELIADGCALLEQWSGNGGVTGKSLTSTTASIAAGTRPGSTTAAPCWSSPASWSIAAW